MVPKIRIFVRQNGRNKTSTFDFPFDNESLDFELLKSKGRIEVRQQHRETTEHEVVDDDVYLRLIIYTITSYLHVLSTANSPLGFRSSSDILLDVSNARLADQLPGCETLVPVFGSLFNARTGVDILIADAIFIIQYVLVSTAVSRNVSRASSRNDRPRASSNQQHGSGSSLSLPSTHVRISP